MTLTELKDVLEGTGLPVAYLAFPENCDQNLPFICYLSTGTNNIFADGSVFYSAENVRVELYTRFKDPDTEKLVETALCGFHWKKTETYIESEFCFMILYEIEV